ncbi:hypothetical protein GW915_04375 [bacterium]|nr:hypothetical protein [bacterium]
MNSLKVFFIFLSLWFLNPSFSQEVRELSQNLEGDSSLLRPPMDPLSNPVRIGNGDGVLVVQAKKAMIPGECAYRKKVAGLVKVYQICAHSKIGSLKAWETAFVVDGDKPADFMLSLDFTYNVGGDRAASSFEEALKNAGVPSSAASTSFLNFVKQLPVEKGSGLELYFGSNLQPGAWLVARFEGKDLSKEFVVEELEFAKGLSSIWLGEKSIDDRIRQTLLK